MAETKANKPKTKKKQKQSITEAEAETVEEAKKQEDLQFWKMTDDEILLRSPEPDDSYKTSDSWRVFRIMGEFVGGFDDLATITNGVSVFGSARTQEDNEYYIAARETARLLAEAGFEVITGGGPGIMEAANRGAFEAGKVSVGCNIELPFRTTAESVSDEISVVQIFLCPQDDVHQIFECVCHFSRWFRHAGRTF